MELKDYLDLACKVINKYGDRTMLKSEDAISYVAEDLIKADNKFNGQGDRLQWMVYCAKFSVLRWRSRGVKYGDISLDDAINRDSIEIQSSKAFNSDLESRDIINQIESAKFISDNQRHCVLNYYLQGMTHQEIGNELGMSKEAVRQNIKNGLEKIRQYVRK